MGRLVNTNSQRRSLRQLEVAPSMVGLDLPLLNAPDPRTGYAVVFLLDRAYLTPLRVFLHSMQGAVRERTCDLVVITNDRLVAEDAFVTGTADRVICLSDEDIAAVGSVRRDAVKRRYRHKDVGKYTFLKLLAYDDLGYRGHLFLDVDMICLDPSFRFEDLFFDNCDFAVAPTIGHEQLGIEQHVGSVRNTVCTPEEQELSELIFTRSLRYRSRRLRSMNSGVFFAGHRLLRRATVNRMLETARAKAFNLEQLISLEVLSKTWGLRFRALGVHFNAPALPLYAMGEDRFERVRDSITFLHYNRNKPWERPRTEADWLERLWWQALDDADAPERPSLLHSKRPTQGRAPPVRWRAHLKRVPTFVAKVRRRLSRTLPGG